MADLLTIVLEAVEEDALHAVVQDPPAQLPSSAGGDRPCQVRGRQARGTPDTVGLGLGARGPLSSAFPFGPLAGARGTDHLVGCNSDGAPLPLAPGR